MRSVQLDRQVYSSEIELVKTRLRPNADFPLVGFDARKLPSGPRSSSHLNTFTLVAMAYRR